MKIFAMPFSKIYPLLVNKALKKNQSQADVNDLITWLTGYDNAKINKLAESDISYADFFKQAPYLNPLSKNIKGSICGVKIATIEDELYRQIRCLDKLIDELAKGQSVTQIITKYSNQQ